MYAAVRRGKLKTGHDEEVARRVNEGLVPVWKKTPGFVAYYVIEAEDGTATTLTVFESQAEDEAANKTAVEWVRQNLAEFMVGPLEPMAGKVLVHATK